MRISGFGHALFGVSLAGLAILSLVYGNFAPILEPFPAWVPWPKVWADGLGRSCWLQAPACSLRAPPRQARSLSECTYRSGSWHARAPFCSNLCPWALGTVLAKP